MTSFFIFTLGFVNCCDSNLGVLSNLKDGLSTNIKHGDHQRKMINSLKKK
jgi:hypothetical protein